MKKNTKAERRQHSVYNLDGQKRKEHIVTERRRKAEYEAKTGHLRGSWGDLPNDPRID